MEDKDTKKVEEKKGEEKTAVSPSVKKPTAGGKKPFKRNPRRTSRRRGRRERVKPEFDHRVVDIRRVTRVVAGGRRFSFSVTLIAGNRKGSVGVGVGKAGDTPSAIDKALRNAKKKVVKLKLTKENSIPYETQAKYSSAVVRIFPTPSKEGVTAGGAVRNVLELAGIKGVSAKILSRSKNKLNNAKAAIKALSKFQ